MGETGFPMLLKGVALLLPVVGVVVIAVALPEAGLVVVQELQASEPLRALPEVAGRYDQPEWPAVFRFEGLAVRLVDDQRRYIVLRLNRNVRGEAWHARPYVK